MNLFSLNLFYTNYINAATTSLKDILLVVREENDISGQVVKPIYPEESDNDSTLIPNQSTSNSCETMRAGYMASDNVEDKFNEKEIH